MNGHQAAGVCLIQECMNQMVDPRRGREGQISMYNRDEKGETVADSVVTITTEF